MKTPRIRELTARLRTLEDVAQVVKLKEPAEDHGYSEAAGFDDAIASVLGTIEDMRQATERELRNERIG